MRLLRTPLLVLCVMAGACVGASTVPSRTLPLPPLQSERDRVFADLGQRAFLALSHQALGGLLLDDQGLRAVLEPEQASRVAALRSSPGADLPVPQDAGNTAFANAAYSGLCIQGARMESAGSPLGLRRAAFVLDRALVAGVEPGGGRVAAWLEGTFVLTDQGFYAIAVQRLETPRRDHADLDLAPCDFRFGGRSPQPVVVSAALSH